MGMKKILIVEDDLFLSNAYRVKLAKSGFETKQAMDGEQVFTALSTYTPDLIILDLVIPKKDGFEVLKELRASEKWKSIPVIVISNLSQQEDIKKILSLGVVTYLLKISVSLEEIIKKVNEILSKNS